MTISTGPAASITTAASVRSDDSAEAGLQVSPTLISRIQEALRGMKYGQVTIAIHDGEVVQVDRVQQTRLFRRRS